MRRFITQFAVVAAALLVIHWVRVGLLLARVFFPPPLVVGIAYSLVYVASSPILPVIVISGLHLCVFALVNAYLFVRVARARARPPWLAGLPSLAFTVVLAFLSLRYWLGPIAHHPTDGALGGIHAGTQVQGATYVWWLGLVNVLGFALAGLVLSKGMRQSRSPTAWLIYNGVLYASLFLFLFPWLGGYP